MVQSRCFGPYEIIRRLGRGMTDVYLAFDTVQCRPTVLKVLAPNNDRVRRLVMEAERRGAVIQKQLHDFDPRVLEIYESGDLDGYFFIAMQYVQGKNVAQILEQEGGIEARCAAGIALEVCRQLERLHSFPADINGRRAGVVHGDIKPSNILIGPEQEVRLLDFGIAKSLSATHHGTHHDFGSPGYCSPERLERARVDRQADLWSLGVTLYEMVAGSPPYRAQNTRKLENLIQSRRPPRALPPGCPRALKAIISKALAGDPAQRYLTASDFHDDLRKFLEDQETMAEQEKRVSWNANATVESVKVAPATKLNRWAFAAAVAAALLSGGVWHRIERPEVRTNVTRVIEPKKTAESRAEVPTDSPGPHLALASRYLYSFRNPDRALAEFRKAERLGHQLTRQEIAQEAEAYRLRARQELGRAQKLRRRSRAQAAKYRRAANRDFAMARRLEHRMRTAGRAQWR